MFSYPFIATRRGRLRLDGVRVVTSFPFGLFVKKAFYAIEGTTVICPEIKPLANDLLLGIQAAGHECSNHRRGHGNELYNLRLYHAGDDSRNIHWATTAKTAKLTVRETEAEDQRRATICLSTVAPESHNTVFENAVSLAASLVHHLAMQDYHLRLVVGSSCSSFGQGENHLVDLLRLLALCERRSPGMDLEPQDNLCTEQPDADEGALVVIRPWRTIETSESGDHVIVVDVGTSSNALHVI